MATGSSVGLWQILPQGRYKPVNESPFCAPVYDEVDFEKLVKPLKWAPETAAESWMLPDGRVVTVTIRIDEARRVG